MDKFSELINSNTPVLVDFYAEWCGPCKTMAPILKDVKTELGESATIIKIDVDKNQHLTANLNVRGVPTLILFKAGEVKWRQSGVVDANSLSQIIKTHI